MRMIEFYGDPAERKEPDIQVDLSKALEEYQSRGAQDQRASCQDPFDFPGKPE